MIQLTIGQVIASRYHVQNFVGAGGMQEVYQAWDVSLSRHVALKTPKNASASKRFQRSAAMSAKATHPNVAKTLDYFVENDRQYLVEELIGGTDLKEQLTNKYFFLDPHLAAHVFHHMARGLAALHKVDVIHRDLKPNNIMVSRDDDLSVVKITDFGVAKMAEAEIEEALKDEDATMASATVVGALPYMAPEVIKNKQNISLQADVWSLGAMVFELLTGKRPFGQGLAAVEKIVSGRLPDKPVVLLSGAQFSHLAGELWELICKCLQTTPSARPTASQLVEACGQLCYSEAQRRQGIVRSYRAGTGNWGFIRDGIAGNPDIFFHADSYWGAKPTEGTLVSYAKFAGDPRERAHPVLPLRVPIT